MIGPLYVSKLNCHMVTWLTCGYFVVSPLWVLSFIIYSYLHLAIEMCFSGHWFSVVG